MFSISFIFIPLNAPLRFFSGSTVYNAEVNMGLYRRKTTHVTAGLAAVDSPSSSFSMRSWFEVRLVSKRCRYDVIWLFSLFDPQAGDTVLHLKLLQDIKLSDSAFREIVLIISDL